MRYPTVGLVYERVGAGKSTRGLVRQRRVGQGRAVGGTGCGLRSCCAYPPSYSTVPRQLRIRCLVFLSHGRHTSALIYNEQHLVYFPSSPCTPRNPWIESIAIPNQCEICEICLDSLDPRSAYEFATPMRPHCQHPLSRKTLAIATAAPITLYSNTSMYCVRLEPVISHEMRRLTVPTVALRIGFPRRPPLATL